MERKLFLVSLLAFRPNNESVDVSVHNILHIGLNIEEAEAAARRAIQEHFPNEDGWEQQETSVTEVPTGVNIDGYQLVLEPWPSSNSEAGN